jgi:hypothetical protein
MAPFQVPVPLCREAVQKACTPVMLVRRYVPVPLCVGADQRACPPV